MVLSLIAAKARNNVIGKDNQLIWHLPADLKFFKDSTRGHHVIMGRKTYESMGQPLPKRTNIVITRTRDYEAPGCIVVHSLEDAIAKIENDDAPFIIGGAWIYRQAIKLVDRMYLSEIDAEFEGDTFFPEFSMDEWEVVSSVSHPPDEANKYAFTVNTYERQRI